MLPNKDELKLIDEAIADTKADPVKARPALIKAFNAAEFTTDQIESWLVVKKETNPELWGAAADPAQAERDAANAALAAEAFTGTGRKIDARGRLVKAVGQPEADRLAKLHGLRNAADFTSIGTAPTADNDEAGDDEAAKAKAKKKDDDKATSSNPWSPKYRGVSTADAERIRIIKTLGTKVAAAMCKKHNVDLAGRPLRQRA
jgi:hypothetical protein